MSIIDLISNTKSGENRDPAVVIAGFRALANSACSRTIDAVRNHIRVERKRIKDAELQLDPDTRGLSDEFHRKAGHEPLRTSLDVRNEQDEASRRSQFKSGIGKTVGALTGEAAEILRAKLHMEGDWDVSGNPGFAADESAAEFGFKIPLEPLQLADLYFRLYQYSVEQIGTMSDSPYDMPLDFRGMLKLRVSNPEPMPMLAVKAYAEALGFPIPDVQKLIERVQNEDAVKLRMDVPAILAEIESLNGATDTFEELPTFAQHQLAIKVGIGLSKARNRTFERMISRRSLGDLGLMPLFKEAIEDVRGWVKTFERKEYEALSEEFDKRQSYLTSADIPRT